MSAPPYHPVQKCIFFPFHRIAGLDKGAWVSFRQNKKMFNIFAGKVRTFKERFFLVRPISEAALDNLLRAVEEPSTVDDEVVARVPFFPL